VWEPEKKTVKKCKCKSACYAPHTPTLHINKQPSPATVFKSETSKYSASVLELHKTSSLQNTFTSLLPEAKISTYLGKQKRKKNIREKHRFCKSVYSERFAFYTETKEAKSALQLPFTQCVGHDTVRSFCILS